MTVAAVKRKLAPWLDEPYFEILTPERKLASGQCAHRDKGVTLEVSDRRVVCRGCGQEVDAFDALIDYSKSETRLVRHADYIKGQALKNEERLARDRVRRLHVRLVASSSPVLDSREGVETVSGHTLMLECGHVLKWPNARRPRTVTCHQCRLGRGKEEKKE